jgi:acyl-coenzyme A thioesterase PaaI-like protein
MLIEKMNNPFESLYEGYHCFGCCKRNEKGLHLDFFRLRGTAYARWEPDADHQGYHNIMHGGIQATMLDEVSAWWVYLIAGTAGFTARLSVRYHKSAPVNDGPLFLRADEVQRRRNLITLRAGLYGGGAEKYASGELEFFTYPPEVAVREMNYPGHDLFYGEWVESSDYGFPDQLLSELA